MAFGLGNVFRSVINPINLASLAMGPAGWANLAMRTIGSQIAMNAIQQLGQRMGLPQTTIDFAQAAFADSVGQQGLVRQNIGQAVRGLAQELDLSPAQSGMLQRELMRASDKSASNLTNLSEAAVRRFGKSEEEEGGSWLVALAKAMGKVLDQKAAQIQEKSNEVAFYGNQSVSKDKTGLTAKSQENQNKLSSASTLLQAYAQEMSFIAAAATNAIKAVGEAQAQLARK